MTDNITTAVHDILADFMVDLCEQKGHPKDCHICQPPNKVYKKTFNRLRSTLTHIQEETRKEILGDEKVAFDKTIKKTTLFSQFIDKKIEEAVKQERVRIRKFKIKVPTIDDKLWNSAIHTVFGKNLILRSVTDDIAGQIDSFLALSPTDREECICKCHRNDKLTEQGLPHTDEAFGGCEHCQ